MGWPFSLEPCVPFDANHTVRMELAFFFLQNLTAQFILLVAEDDSVEWWKAAKSTLGAV
jgi:hypothetical protein